MGTIEDISAILGCEPGDVVESVRRLRATRDETAPLAGLYDDIKTISAILGCVPENAVESVRQLQAIREDTAALARLHDDEPLKQGEARLFLTPRHYYLGKIAAVYPDGYALRDATMLMGLGRVRDFLANGRSARMRVATIPNGRVFLARSYVLAAFEWEHETRLPSS